MKRFYPAVGDVWRHASGKEYIVMSNKINDETRQYEVVVAYLDQRLAFVRATYPIEEFMDEVDHDFHPELKQKYLFEFVKAKEEV